LTEYKSKIGLAVYAFLIFMAVCGVLLIVYLMYSEHETLSRDTLFEINLFIFVAMVLFPLFFILWIKRAVKVVL